MGAIYRIKCERGGVVFEHSVGVGFAYACVGCGEMSLDGGGPIYCPVCNRRYDPEVADFERNVVDTIRWD